MHWIYEHDINVHHDQQILNYQNLVARKNHQYYFDDDKKMLEVNKDVEHPKYVYEDRLKVLNMLYDNDRLDAN